MSEENRWDEDLPEVNENVPTEEKPLDTFGNTDTGSAADNSTENIDIAQKPMAHPYSAGRRMQENGYGNGTNSSNFQNNTSFQEKPKYAHYEVHQPQAGNYAGGSIPPKKPHKPKTWRRERRLWKEGCNSRCPGSDLWTGGRCCFSGSKYCGR